MTQPDASVAPAFEYHEAPVPQPIADVAHSLWGFWTTPDAPEICQHTVWADGCVSFGVSLMPTRAPMFIRVPATVSATMTTVRRGDRFFGLRLWPDTGMIATPALGAASAELVERVASCIEPEAIWREIGEWAMKHIVQRKAPDAHIRAAIRVIVERGGGIATAALAGEVGLGPRQLQRRFLAATGFTIKSYARVRRMRTALSHRLSELRPWSITAAATGFADQAHLAREFTTLTGLAPRQVEEHLARIEHRNVTP